MATGWPSKPVQAGSQGWQHFEPGEENFGIPRVTRPKDMRGNPGPGKVHKFRGINLSGTWPWIHG